VNTVCGHTQDRSVPCTPTRGTPEGRIRELTSPTLRGEEPASIVVPRPVRLAIKISTISAGSRHTLALTTDGDVFSWGWGAQGQLGLGHTNSLAFPTKIEALTTPIKAISAGGIHSSCLDTEGQCYMWGSSEYGQLGIGPDVSCQIVPQPLLSVDEATPFLFSKVSCGGMHTAAIDLNGDLWCWGRADSGQTGSGKWVFSYFPGLVYPKKVAFIGGVTDVVCGGFHTVVLTKEGAAFSMGKEDFGVLGTGIANSKKMRAGTESLTAVAALAEQKIVGVSCGGWHSMFWTDDGKLYACGKGEYGRLGLGSEQNVPSPELVSFGEANVKVVSASCGGSHSLILTSDGRVYSVGRSDDGRLGLGQVVKTKIMTPTLVSSGMEGQTVQQVVAGGAHSLILAQGGQEFVSPSTSPPSDGSSLAPLG
jgi:alpha-tubulin suppressor-like RCC1 family protein